MTQANINRKKINLYDLKESDEILRKIKSRSNKGVFDQDQVRSPILHSPTNTTFPQTQSKVVRKSTKLAPISSPHNHNQLQQLLDDDLANQEREQ